MGKALVACYSYSGNTRALAGAIAARVKGDVREIIPRQPYSFDHNTASKNARSEIQRGFCPKLSSGHEPIDGYGVIFVGTPNWFKSLAPLVLAFLRLHDFCGKTLVPFCTHGGGGFGGIEDKIAAECPEARLLPGLAAGHTATEQQVASWLRDVERRR